MIGNEKTKVSKVKKIVHNTSIVIINLLQELEMNTEPPKGWNRMMRKSGTQLRGFNLPREPLASNYKKAKQHSNTIPDSRVSNLQPLKTNLKNIKKCFGATPIFHIDGSVIV